MDNGASKWEVRDLQGVILQGYCNAHTPNPTQTLTWQTAKVTPSELNPGISGNNNRQTLASPFLPLP